MDHLGELRRRVTIILIALIVCACVVYLATPTIIQMLIDPIRAYLPNGGELTVLSSLGGFTIRFKVALFCAAIITSPIIIWEIMAFFLPALKPKERRWAVPTVAALVVLFFIGMIFCYVVILPAAFGWMSDQTLGFATQIANAEDYLTILMLLEIGFGVAFELPLVIFYLSVLHLVPYKTFRENWRYIYVALLVLSAFTTPDASPVTMFFMFAALVLLYELSLWVARLIIVSKDGKAALKWTREDYANSKE
jgi:sec-independent protein translocase protein TatC